MLTARRGGRTAPVGVCAIGVADLTKGRNPGVGKVVQPAARIRHAASYSRVQSNPAHQQRGVVSGGTRRVAQGEIRQSPRGEFLPQHDASGPKFERQATLRMKRAIPIPGMRIDLGGSFSGGSRFRCRKAGQEPRAAPSLMCPWSARLRNITWFCRIITRDFIAQPRCGSAPRSSRPPGSACSA
jgi:hypothetical protein